MFPSDVTALTIATATSSVVKQLALGGTVDHPCVVVSEAAFAGLARVAVGSAFPNQVSGRYPFWHNRAFYAGKHAQREYKSFGIELPFAIAAGGLSAICDLEASPGSGATSGKE
jgi:hypothetical protein